MTTKHKVTPAEIRELIFNNDMEEYYTFEKVEELLADHKKEYGEIANFETIAHIANSEKGSQKYHDVELAMYALLYHNINKMKGWSDSISDDVEYWVRREKITTVEVSD